MIVQRPDARVEAEPAGSQQMQQTHSCVAVALVLGYQGRELDTVRRNPQGQLFQGAFLQSRLSVAIEQPQVRKQRTVEELLLGDDVKGPASGGGELLAHGQFSLDGWIGKTLGRLDFHQALGAVGHLHQEVGHNVAGPAILPPSTRRGGRTIEQLNLEIRFFPPPGVPDGQGLLFNPRHARTSDQDHGRGGLELPLATDRTFLPRAGN